MPIRVACTKCNSTFVLPESKAGKKVQCSKCMNTFRVPGAAEGPVEEPAEVAPIEVSASAVSAKASSALPTGSFRGRGPASNPRGRNRADYNPTKALMPIFLIGGGALLALALVGSMVGLWWYWNFFTGGVPSPVGQTPTPPPLFVRPNPIGVNPNPPPVIHQRQRDTPLDVDDAVDMIRHETGFKRKGAAEWLTKQVVIEGKRKDVSDALIKMANDESVFNQEAALKALHLWGTRDNAEAVRALLESEASKWEGTWKASMDCLLRWQDPKTADLAIKELNGFGGKRDHAARILENLGKDKVKDKLIPLANSIPGHHRDAFDRLFLSLGIKEAELVDQNIDDLKPGSNKDVRLSACQRLARITPPLADKQEKVSKALVPVLNDQDNRVREAALEAASIWGTKEIIDTLILQFQGVQGATWNRQKLMDALAKFKDDRVYAALASQLADFFNHEKAVELLTKIGPDAEKQVIPFLGSNDAAVRQRAARVLLTIGTKTSLPILKANTQRDPDVQARTLAAQAILAINQREAAPKP